MSLKVKEKIIEKSSSNKDELASFIKKTYDMLQTKKHVDVVSWSDDGSSIIIKDCQKFAQKVLPAYFKHNNITSFVRQLNMYNFHKKKTANPEEHVYCHELFRKGNKHLLKDIKRKCHENNEKALTDTENLTEQFSMNNSLLQENLMLKKVNEQAFQRILALETKVKELSLVNQSLGQKISEYARQQIMFQTIIADLKKSNSSSPANAESEEPTLLPETLTKPTPDTMLNTEDVSTYESYLNLDQNLECISEQTFSTQINNFEEPVPKLNNNTFYEDECVLGKREFSNSILGEPVKDVSEAVQKHHCLGISQEAQDQNLNMIDFNLFQYFDREFE